MSDPKPYPQWLFWLLASAFLWGFLIAPIGVKKFIGWNQWSTLFGYPMICWTAAAGLVKAKRNGALAFAVWHALLGIGWITFALWAFRAIADSLWK